MKKIISIILTFLFLFNIGGYYIWFSALQYSIQKEIKQEIIKGLNVKKYTIITVSINNESDICWIKPNKEFSYNGRMYDVAKIKIKNQIKYYYCINDIKEKQHIDNFDKNYNSNKKIYKIVKNTFNNLYFPQQYFWVNNICSSDIIYATIIFLYKSNVLEISAPPPKLV